jgi:hypothetical protein
VIYVVPEESLYDVSQESESTDNVEMNVVYLDIHPMKHMHFVQWL